MTSADPATPGVEVSVDEEFLALVYGDTELLRAEFDALIAAGWGTPPPRFRPTPGSAGPCDPSGAPGVTSPPPPTPRTITSRSARQRSPPDTAQLTITRGKE